MRTRAFSLVVFLLSEIAAAGELAEPVPILVGNKPLDVEQMGHAYPSVADFDGDGVKDLLVGEFYKGRLRIYRNVGSNKEPRFENFTLFQDGDAAGCIHSSCCMGFGPQMIDFDHDGHPDMLSGNWIYQVILFRGGDHGTFAPGEPIKDRGDKPINIGYGVSAFAIDWDVDGDLDLLAGTVEKNEKGNVFLVLNEGTATHHAFGKPDHLVAGGTPIIAADGGAGPVTADWDGDGNLDLILGCGDGSVRWYRNTGTRQAPAFSSFEILVKPPVKGSERGRDAKVCVTDWNEDGRLDLVVGDCGERFEKHPSAEEKQWRDDARLQQATFLADWAKSFARYRELMAASSAVPEASREDHQQKLAAARGIGTAQRGPRPIS